MSDMQKTYDKLGTSYSRWTQLQDRTVVNKMRDKVLGGAKGTILEIAICDGKNLRYYAPGSHVVGVDLSPVMLNLAKDRAQKLNIDFTPHVSDVSKLQFPDESFDYVVCALGGCTFSEPDKVFAEMRRVLSPKGRALFVEHVQPKSWWGQAVMKAITPVTRRLLGCHPNRDTATAIQKAGFRFERVEKAAGGLLLGITAERV